MTDVKHCPYEDAECDIQEVYDAAPLPTDVIATIASNISDEELVVEALKVAGRRTFRGLACKTCGAFFSA